MITDRIQLAGLGSYFRTPVTRAVNLGGATATIRTDPLPQGKQLEISGLQLLIEHEDLRPLMQFQFDGQDPPQPAPLLKFSVVKEMFPGLFADPYSHRVHNIAGFLDFNEGTLTNGRVLEIDGIPTIVSVGAGECVWVSKTYEMPEPISIQSVAWELATSRLTPPDSFHYEIQIVVHDRNSGADDEISIDDAGQMLKADAPRAREILKTGLTSFRIRFAARVNEDSYLSERHLPVIQENLGRPLLRAINILEPIRSIYEIYSLSELQTLCSDIRYFDTPGPEVTRFTAILNLNAVLVNSVNQFVHPDNVLTNPVLDPYHAASKYEFVELKLLTPTFTRFEAKRLGTELRRELR